ncbi:hypothetical protein C8Q79DRAFT_495204 [Trametes meyenii]|nr:hypothetical protein C8Q79DRAFT_495204 [Trametes meyenii]
MPDSFTEGDLIVYAADDADLNSITYNGQWAHLGRGFNASYMDTGSIGVVGSSASMNFTGLAVLLYNAIPADLTPTQRLNPPNVTVSLDGNTPTRVTVTTGNDDPFFQAGPLNAGTQHTITVTIDAQTDDFPFALDLVAYGGFRNQSQPQGQQIIAQGQNASGILGSSDGLTASPSASQSKSSGPPVGPIVGGVVGGTALLVLIALAVWYVFVRPRRQGGRAFFYAPGNITDILSSETEAKPDPYQVGIPTTTPSSGPASQASSQALLAHRQTTIASSEASSSQGPESVSGYGYGYPASVHHAGPAYAYAPSTYHDSSSVGGSDATATTAAAAAAHRRKAEQAGVLSVPPPTTYHADSGIRFGGDGAGAGPSTVPDLSDVPPTYSER